MNTLTTKLSLAFILVVLLGVASVSILVRMETTRGFESYLQAQGGASLARAADKPGPALPADRRLARRPTPPGRAPSRPHRPPRPVRCDGPRRRRYLGRTGGTERGRPRSGKPDARDGRRQQGRHSVPVAAIRVRSPRCEVRRMSLRSLAPRTPHHALGLSTQHSALNTLSL